MMNTIYLFTVEHFVKRDDFRRNMQQLSNYTLLII